MVIMQMLRFYVCSKAASSIFRPMLLKTYVCMESGREEMEMPSVWSQVCLQNVASLAKEATTVRRMLEPMFRYFDKGRHWSLQHGLALAVLGDIQLFMEKTGQCWTNKFCVILDPSVFPYGIHVLCSACMFC